MLTVAAYR